MGTMPKQLGPLVDAIAEELEVLKVRSKLSLRELAARSGVPHPTLSKSLAGKRPVDVDEFGRMCAALGVSPDVVMRDALATLAARGIRLRDLLPNANITPLRPKNVGASSDDLAEVAYDNPTDHTEDSDDYDSP